MHRRGRTSKARARTQRTRASSTGSSISTRTSGGGSNTSTTGACIRQKLDSVHEVQATPHQNTIPRACHAVSTTTQPPIQLQEEDGPPLKRARKLPSLERAFEGSGYESSQNIEFNPVRPSDTNITSRNIAQAPHSEDFAESSAREHHPKLTTQAQGVALEDVSAIGDDVGRLVKLQQELDTHQHNCERLAQRITLDETDHGMLLVEAERYQNAAKERARRIKDDKLAETRERKLLEEKQEELAKLCSRIQAPIT